MSKCPKCQSENNEGTNFCIKCGEKVESFQSIPVKQDTVVKKAFYKDFKNIVIGACALSIVVLITVVVSQGMTIQKISKNQKYASTTVTTRTSAPVTSKPTPAKPTPTAKPNPVKVYEDSKVKISFLKIAEEGIVFEVENLTDVNITIQANSISVNKRSINDILMSDDVAPQSIGEVTAQCNIDITTDVESIGGQLRIIDFGRSFNSYDASFVNISVK